MDINQVAVELGLQEFGPSPHQVSCPRSKAGGGGRGMAGTSGQKRSAAKRSEGVM